VAPRDPSFVSHQLLPVPTYSRVPRHICICLHLKRTKRKTNRTQLKCNETSLFTSWQNFEQFLNKSWSVLDLFLIGYFSFELAIRPSWLHGMGIDDSVEVDRMNMLTHLHQQEPVDESAPSDDAIVKLDKMFVINPWYLFETFYKQLNIFNRYRLSSN